MEQINIWELWERNWNSAYKFFNSKGNTTTKSRLKDKWYKEFVKDLKLIEETVRSTRR